jgi:hypothetical protein
LQLRSLERSIDFDARAKHELELPLLKAFKRATEEKQRLLWVEHRRMQEVRSFVLFHPNAHVVCPL